MCVCVREHCTSSNRLYLNANALFSWQICLLWLKVCGCMCVYQYVCMCLQSPAAARSTFRSLFFCLRLYHNLCVCVCLFLHFCICPAFALPQCFIRFICLLFGHSRRSQPGPPPFLQTAAFWTWNFCLFAFSFAFPILGSLLLFYCCCLRRYPASGARSFSLPLALRSTQLRQLRMPLGLSSFRLLCSAVVVNSKRAGEWESKLSVVVFVRARHVAELFFFFGQQEVKAKAHRMISITITCDYFNWA